MTPSLGNNARRVTIFQLGDLHFPGFGKLRTEADTKDNRGPSNLDQSLRLPLTQAIRKALVKAISEEDNPILAICGDLTTGGSAAGLEEAIEFLESIVDDPLVTGVLDRANIHLVPGNHDVAYKAGQPFETFEDVDRFDDLKARVSSSSLGDVLATSIRTTRLSRGNLELRVLSLNTARGAGASRTLLSGITQDALLEAITSTMSEAEIADVVTKISDEGKELAEVLDIPLVHPDDIVAFSECIAETESSAVSVLVGHHGLLPQHTPRLNPYTEMANGGQVRRALERLGRPLIYLHGHIHADVVEVIKFPSGANGVQNGAPLVIVAAPELSEGFNRIDIEFDSSGTPLGMTLTKYRISHGEQVVLPRPEKVRVTLSARSPSTPQQRKLVRALAKTGSSTGSSLVQKAGEFSPPLTAEGVEDYVKSLVWDGTVVETTVGRSEFAEKGFLFP